MKRMNKRLLCVSLCLCLMLSGLAASLDSLQPAAPQRQELSITTLKEFLDFAENCIIDSYSRNLDVKLCCDLDIGGTNFAPIPIFCGSFDGQGHTISGLKINGDGSNQGLFRYLSQTAEVKNLVVKGKASPGGSRSSIGGIAGNNAGHISACAVNIEIVGADNVGGIAGENQVTGTIEGCSVSGSISGNHFVGGIAGSNLGVIRGCVNKAEINVTSQQNVVSLSEITMDSITGSESASTVTDVGGIAGISEGVIRGCENHAPVGYKHMGYNVGGIAGTQVGYIVDCTNYADISGRKEVGGIVGQMEPTAFVAFEQDALQMLQQQVDALAGSLSQMSSNVQGTTGAIGGQVNEMMGQVGQTQQALQFLYQGGLNEDSIQAAYNVIGGSVAGLTQSMQNMAATTASAVGALSNNLYAMQSQINAMRSTIGNISDAVGGTMKDVSDEDSPEKLGGKVENCRNTAHILGDINVGGITGAIAFENDLDISEDIDLGDNSSLNFVSEIRAVILNSQNSGSVELVYNYGGGVVGMTEFGLLRECKSTGLVTGADYVGGVAGLSKSFIRSSSAKGELTGGAYVGGIAGEGTTVTDCRSMVRISGNEKTGAVLGWGEQSYNEQSRPSISGNLYCFEKNDYGGIDGISYSGVAQPLAESQFYSLPGLSDIFKVVNLSFIQEDGEVEAIKLPVGGSVDESLIPVPKAKEGYIVSWKDFDNQGYEYDTSFYAVYSPLATTLESLQRDENGLPLLLAEGSFQPGSSLELVGLDTAPALAEGQELVASVYYRSSDGGQADTIRYRVGAEPGRLTAYMLMDDGRWKLSEFELMGSYAVMELPQEARGIALISTETPLWNYAVAACGALLIILIVWMVLAIRKRVRRRKRKKAAAMAR